MRSDPERAGEAPHEMRNLMVVVVGSSSVWAAGGAALGRVIEDARTRRVVSVALAILLVASVALIWA